MSELNRMRMELKADIELIAIRQGDLAKTTERMSQTIEAHGAKIAEQGEHIFEQAKLMYENSRETARLGREVAESSRWIQGRMRLLGERFDAVLGALESAQAEDRAILSDLVDRVAGLESLPSRVARLEQDRSSAA